jgi:hypothetical protein
MPDHHGEKQSPWWRKTRGAIVRGSRTLGPLVTGENVIERRVPEEHDECDADGPYQYDHPIGSPVRINEPHCGYLPGSHGTGRTIAGSVQDA